MIKHIQNAKLAFFSAPVLALLFFGSFSCSRKNNITEVSGNTHLPIFSAEEIDAELSPLEREAFISDYWFWALGDAGLPVELSEKIIYSLMEEPAFVMDLLEILKEEKYLYLLIDKNNPLPEDYVPSDLTELKEGNYRVSHSQMMLRSPAEISLNEMAAEAKKDGVILTAGSAYRSYNYQIEVYNRYVRQMGQEEADRISARPGHSQHQLGLVVDFYPIDDAFAQTSAGIWMEKNASRFGWSLSFPKGYEEVTGYSWESWHFRYTGKELADFIDKYFDGIQQYALQFIQSWIVSSEIPL